MDDDVANGALIDAARALRPLIEAAAAQTERERRLPAELLRALTDAGLFRLTAPRSLGGCEVDLPTLWRVVEEVAKADGSTAWCIAQNAGVVYWAGLLPEAGAREVFGPETRAAGGHGPATAMKVDGGYKVTGHWAYASGIRHANWLRGTCAAVDASGETLRRADGSAEHEIVFFPASEAELIDVWNVSGLRGTASDTYTVTDLFVPEQRVVLDAPRETGPLYALGTNQVFSSGFAAVALGVARASLDALVAFASEKTPRGVSGLLREETRVQAQVAQSEATLRSARAYLRDAVDEVWDAAQTGRLPLEARVTLRLATVYAIQQAASVVDAAYLLAGGDAIFVGKPFERRFRDMHAITQQVQSRLDHFEHVGRYLMGLDPDGQWL